MQKFLKMHIPSSLFLAAFFRSVINPVEFVAFGILSVKGHFLISFNLFFELCSMGGSCFFKPVRSTGSFYVSLFNGRTGIL